ncbi:MAG: hypothetical protein ACREQN_10405 [Candidatus Binataceae bacterium]
MAIVMTLVIAVLLGTMALGTDIAVMYLNWAWLQKAADSAAVAGANYLPGTNNVFDNTASSECDQYQSDSAKLAACSYAMFNGVKASDTLTLDDTTNSGDMRVTVVRTNLPYFFGKFVGLTDYSVAAHATAQQPLALGDVPSGVFPAALQCALNTTGTDCASGSPPDAQYQIVTLGQPPLLNLGASTPGNWAWIDLDGNGGATLSANIANGGTVNIALQDLISVMTEPGKKVGPVDHGFSTRVANHNAMSAACTAVTYAQVCSGAEQPCPGDPLSLIVPVVNFVGAHGKSTVPVAGFAAIYADPSQSLSKGQISGCFISTLDPTGVGIAGAPALGPTGQPELID